VTGPARRRPGLAAVSFAETAGGLAYAARLLRYALTSWCGSAPWMAALEPARYGRVSAGERARFSARVVGAQLSGRVDWLVFNHVGVARVQRLVPPPARRPYAVFVHDVEAWDPDLDAHRRAVLRGAAVRVSNSAYTAARIERTHPDVGPVVACPLGLLDDAMEADVATDPAPAWFEAIGPLSVLIVGRMHDTERYKGHDELLAVWPSVVAQVPGAQLVMAGLGNDRERLAAKARAAGVAQSVIFTGFVPAAWMPALWARVALFAMPSAREGFGLVYLEAMRAGRACIGSTADAAGDVIVDGETGVLVDRDDPAALGAAVVALLCDGPRREALGAAGRRRYLAEFTADHFAARLRDIFDSPLGAC
jgi:phosphatidylinositol alpha-1,6-mannosyltransferase